MTTPWEAVGLWPVRAALAGGVVLLAGRLALALTRSPGGRARLGPAAVAAALLVIPLTLLPGWLSVTLGSAAPTAVASAPIPAPAAEEPNTNARDQVPWMPDRAGPLPPLAAAPRAPAAGSAAPTPEAAGLPAIASAPTIWPAGPVRWDRALLVGYGLIAGLHLVRLGVGHVAIARRWRAARPAPDWAENVFRRMAKGTCPRAELRVSVRTGPICFGVLRPRVLVPAGLLTAGDGPALRAVFAHELGHLARRDPLAGWLLGLARAAYFVWPWLAGIRRQVRLAQEHLADADAARETGPADYAELLIRMTRNRAVPLGAAGVRDSSSELYRRVTMLLRTGGRVEGRSSRRWALVAGGGLTALAVFAAGLSVQPRQAGAAEPEKKADKKDSPKPETTTLKDVIEKLKKDVGDDPEAVKRLEELRKSVEPVQPKAADRPPVPAPPPVQPFPVVPPIFDPNLPEDELLKELLQGQDQLLKQLEQMLGQVQGRGGIMIGPGGIRPLGAAAGGGRLGVRVEKPSDVLAAQLDLPAGQGLVCVDVPADSTAGKAGLKPHDILLEVGGKPVPSDRDAFVRNLGDVKPDAPVDIVVLRKGHKETIKGVKLPKAREPDVPVLPGLEGFPRLEGFDLVPPARVAPPQLFPRPAADIAPRADGPAPVPLGPGETVRVEQVNDAFTVFYSKNGVKVTVTGSKDADGAAKAESIEVEDGGKTTKAESIDKLPKGYQDLAKTAMKAIK
jgi:beta-lactamase regulating signal transducer with metallopeptidase domain